MARPPRGSRNDREMPAQRLRRRRSRAHNTARARPLTGRLGRVHPGAKTKRLPAGRCAGQGPPVNAGAPCGAYPAHARSPNPKQPRARRPGRAAKPPIGAAARQRTNERRAHRHRADPHRLRKRDDRGARAAAREGPDGHSGRDRTGGTRNQTQPLRVPAHRAPGTQPDTGRLTPPSHHDATTGARRRRRQGAQPRPGTLP